MANTIKLKRSSTASDTPTASDLEVGELAVNTADAKLFTKHTDNSIVEISGSGGSYANSDVDTHLNTSTASANEVLSWNGSDYDWVAQSGGGGGATNLTGLSDVTISSVQNNDLLMYNATASEWQNTNLGVTVDPTVTIPSGTIYAGAPLTATVAPSSGSYQQVSFFAEVRNAANTSTIISNANITKTATSVSFAAPAAGNYILRVKAQDFGDISSEFATASFSTTTPSGTRYIRIFGAGANSHTMVMDLMFYTGTGQTGTVYPDTVGHMYSPALPSPLVASSSGEYAGYQAYEAFDSNTTSTTASWWNLAQTPYSSWYLELDTGQYVNAIQSAQIKLHPSYYGGSNIQSLTLKTSNTGAFSGEETTVASTTNEVSGVAAGGTFTIG